MDPASTPSAAERRYEASQIIHRHALYVAAASAGWNTRVWPVSSPAVTVLQMRMLSALAEHYGIPFTPASVKPALASIAGGALSYAVSGTPVLIFMKAWLLTIPAIGIPLRFATGPALLATYTYFLGRAFAEHFEAGRDAADFDISEFRVGLLRRLSLR